MTLDTSHCAGSIRQLGVGSVGSGFAASPRGSSGSRLLALARLMLEMHAMNDGAQDVQYARLAGDERQSASVHPTPQQYSLLDADQLPSEPKRYARKLSNIRHPCPTCCAVFSLSGMVFLLWVSVFLAGDSTYLILDGTDDKTKLAGSVYGAAGMYLACFLVSAAVYVKRRQFP